MGKDSAPLGVVFVAGLLLGFLLASGLFGSYLMFGTRARIRELQMREAENIRQAEQLLHLEVNQEEDAARRKALLEAAEQFRELEEAGKEKP